MDWFGLNILMQFDLGVVKVHFQKYEKALLKVL